MWYTLSLYHLKGIPYSQHTKEKKMMNKRKKGQNKRWKTETQKQSNFSQHKNKKNIYLPSISCWHTDNFSLMNIHLSYLNVTLLLL